MALSPVLLQTDQVHIQSVCDQVHIQSVWVAHNMSLFFQESHRDHPWVAVWISGSLWSFPWAAQESLHATQTTSSTSFAGLGGYRIVSHTFFSSFITSCAVFCPFSNIFSWRQGQHCSWAQCWTAVSLFKSQLELTLSDMRAAPGVFTQRPPLQLSSRCYQSLAT